MSLESLSDSRPRNLDSGISKGSYSHASYASLRGMGPGNGIGNANLKGSTKGSQVFSSPVSRVSLSRLRLGNSAKEKKWEELEDFNIEELRDGFFDAVFTKAERLNSDKEEDEQLIGTKKSENTSGNFLSYAKNLQNDFFSNALPIFKYFIAYFIALVICVIHRSGNWVGHQYRYFLPIAVLIHHPVRTVGVQLEMTIASVLGASLGLGWSALAWYVSVATKVTASHQGGVLFGSLVIALLFSIWLKELYQRILYISLSFNVAIIFLHNVSLVSSRDELRWTTFWDFGISYLFGILLSLLICVLVSPRSGNTELIEHYSNAIANMRNFLAALVNKDEAFDEEKLHLLQKSMIKSLNVGLSEGYREFANQWTLSRYDKSKLKNFRNSLTTLMSPLRILPLSQRLLNRAELDRLYDLVEQKKFREASGDPESNFTTGDITPSNVSGASTPFTRNGISLPYGSSLNDEIYLSVLRSTFSAPIFGLMLEMVIMLENMSSTLSKYKTTKSGKIDLDALDNLLNRSKTRLKRKIYKLDVCYKNFTKSSFFGKDMLTNADFVDIFLFLRYLRNAAKHMIEASHCCYELGTELHWHIVPQHYPLSRASIRLPKQCALDEGAGNVLHYFETKRDVDDIFERSYNAYTSRHKYSRQASKNGQTSLRAIDHNDFNFHTTQNPWRYKLWKLSSALVGPEMKWTIKVLFVIIFLCLPGWLPQSYNWYDSYQCWWAPMMFYFLAHRKFSGKWAALARRFSFALIGIFWGWAANQARHFGSPYVICTFGGIILFIFAFNFLVYNNTKGSFIALICYTVIALEPYSKGEGSLNTAEIWKNTWVTGLSFIVAMLLSVPINWVVWSFKARSELRFSVSSLLAHISQSYQAVTDRYLYRDANDSPTELTLALSHIREVRLTQSMLAVRELLTRAKQEPVFISNFSPSKYEHLLDACEFLLEKVIEARVSGSFFEVWDQDLDNDTTRALLSLRRDSVSSVIFIFYILSNCFRSKNKIPIYLPNPVLSRKKLYDFLSEFEQRKAQLEISHRSGLNKKFDFEGASKDISMTRSGDIENYERVRWTEIHGVAFARAFTDITEAMHIVVTCAKQILGEEHF
ncbi:hypothetical protein HG535_0G01100 [Zygotorulaspora mrakii]|uniref:Uncharacterized protein n=1 Tax=Zygotorulaspora mrakii TaxID=42260 RepID=A0A7H9B796_ZYGMR|nr:uncharacterized protein HG535_0G01100 [Zygotorulaspora mrakii]QLG74226.1 hypothetical protein HG535_0G01100 [Zygotorulaspora mrakii]